MDRWRRPALAPRVMPSRRGRRSAPSRIRRSSGHCSGLPSLWWLERNKARTLPSRGETAPSFPRYSQICRCASNCPDIVSYREGGPVRCSRCGNDNPETNLFCGTCGASLLAATVPTAPVRGESASQASPMRAPSAPMPAVPRTAAPASEEEVPAISGPSFLGLNAPPARNSDRGSNLGRSSQSSRTSGNLDYLLDDDDEPKSGAGKIFLILIALALAVGFGYLRWRHEGLSSLMSGWQKPSATAQPSHSSQPGSSAGTPATTPDSSSAASQPPPTPSQPATTQSAATQTATSPGADSSSSPATAPSSTAPNASVPGTNAPGTTAGSQAAAGNPAPAPEASASSTGDSPPADKSAAKPAAKDEAPAAADSAEPDPNEKPAEPAPAPKRAARSQAPTKPSAAT